MSLFSSTLGVLTFAAERSLLTLGEFASFSHDASSHGVSTARGFSDTSSVRSLARHTSLLHGSSNSHYII